MPVGNPPHHGTKTAEFCIYIIWIYIMHICYYCQSLLNKCHFYLLWVKRGYFGKNGALGVFWADCEVGDLKQRQRTAAMDHRTKIQSALSTHMALETLVDRGEGLAAVDHDRLVLNAD